MRKWMLFLGFVFMAGSVHTDELRPQFRVWKSSWIGTGTLTNTLVSSSPIIFHMIFGSATMNIDSSYFTLFSSTHHVTLAVDASTRAFVPLGNTQNMPQQDKIGVAFDVKSTTNSFIRKVGGAAIGYEWDWYGHAAPAPNDRLSE